MLVFRLIFSTAVKFLFDNILEKEQCNFLSKIFFSLRGHDTCIYPFCSTNKQYSKIALL